MELGTDRMIAQKDGAIGWMIFNSPERRNAVSYEMRLAMVEILDDFQRDDAIRVVIMKGMGDRAFISGSDISQFESKRSSEEDIKTYSEASQKVDQRFAALDKPLIAMINGYCLGYGMMVAMAADFRIAADNAQFGIPAARLGLGFGYGATRQLVELVGPANAKDILMTARRVDAEEAQAMGLVHRVTTVEGLEEAVMALAATLSDNAPLTLKLLKFQVGEILKDESARDVARCQAMVDACSASEDYIEGRRAFMEKRRPQFKGR